MEELEHIFIVDWYLPKIGSEEQKEQDASNDIIEKIFVDYAKKD